MPFSLWRSHMSPARGSWRRRSLIGGLCLLAAALAAGCKDRAVATTPTSLAPTDQPGHLAHEAEPGPLASHGKPSLDKGYIDGWFDGDLVQLHYTKVFFCKEPPDSGAESHCEVGADAEVAPRPGPIPTIYAIAAVGGIQPDVATIACPAGSPCLNHPAMIDVSRVRPGATNAPALPHSHILGERRAGWFNTVNIRVSNLDVWNQIAAAKSLAKIRELQADPEVGGRGLISQDTPTNIFFFIASWR
jgi:hypothetical protein